MSTVSDLCQSALEDLGVLGAGETVAASDLTTCFKSLNQLVDQWAAEQLTIYSITETTWTITANDGAYDVGATAGAGNVVVARPVYIKAVNYRDTSVSPVVEYALTALTDDDWEVRQSIKTLTSVFPTSYYYNPTYPLGTLNLWPVPTSSTLTGVMYAPAATAQFAATSTTVALPPGYERFIVKNLALEVAPKFGAVPSPGIIQAASESKRAIKVANIRPADMSFDAGALINSNYWSYQKFRSG